MWLPVTGVLEVGDSLIIDAGVCGWLEGARKPVLVGYGWVLMASDGFRWLSMAFEMGLMYCFHRDGWLFG